LKKGPASFGTLPDYFIPLLASFIRSWAEKREIGKEWKGERQPIGVFGSFRRVFRSKAPCSKGLKPKLFWDDAFSTFKDG